MTQNNNLTCKQRITWAFGLNMDDEVTTAEKIKLKQVVALALKEYTLAHTTIELEFIGEDCRDYFSVTVSNPRPLVLYSRIF